MSDSRRSTRWHVVNTLALLLGVLAVVRANFQDLTIRAAGAAAFAKQSPLHGRALRAASECRGPAEFCVEVYAGDLSSESRARLQSLVVANRTAAPVALKFDSLWRKPE